MTSTRRVRPRPSSWSSGSARFVLSVAAIVRNGLHATVDAYTLPGCLRAESRLMERSTDIRSNSLSSLGEDHIAQEKWTARSGSAGASSHSSRGRSTSGRRHSDGRRGSSLSVVASAVAATAEAPALSPAAFTSGTFSGRGDRSSGIASEEAFSPQERRAANRGVQSIAQFAFREHTSTKPMTVSEEIKLVGEVKLMTGYVKTRANLSIVLGREPSQAEWATSVGLTSHELAMRMLSAQTAQERIVESNVGLIVLMARRYHPVAMFGGTLTTDIIQEGSLALLRAAETFDPKLGYRFSTYAGWWVRDRVQRCVVQQARIIRLPQHVHTFRRNITKAEQVLTNDLGRAPTYVEIAEHMEVDEARVIRYANCPDTYSLDGAPATAGNGDASSTDMRKSGKASGEGYQHEKVACSMISPEQQAESILYQSNLDQLMSVLSPDERLIVSLRYGLGGASPTPLGEVAQKAGSTKHRVRMMETRALNKLRRRPGRVRHGLGWATRETSQW